MIDQNHSDPGPEEEQPIASLFADRLRVLSDIGLVTGALLCGTVIWVQATAGAEVDRMDVFGEAVMGLSVATGYLFVRKLGVPAMTIGWTFLVLGFLIDISDEFKPDFRPFEIGQPILLVGGFLITALGLHGSYRALRRQLKRAVDAEADSEASQRKFKELFQAAPVGYWELDLEGFIGRANAAAHRLIGASNGDLRGIHLKDLLANGSGQQAWGCPEGQENYAEGKVLELELLHADGRPRTVLAHRNAIRDSEGLLTGSRMALMDMTVQRRMEEDRERLEKQLQHSQRLETIGTLAGGIAHDFNNLLVPILGNLEFALEEIPSDSPLHSDLAEAESAAMRAKELVRQILTFSRKGDRRLQPVRVQDVVKEVSGLLKHSLPSTIEIVTNTEMDTPLVEGDQGQLHQVLMNLCANASHAMDAEGGQLFLSVRPLNVGPVNASPFGDLQPGSYAHLSVKDTGIGMDASTLEKIFDPFFTTKGVDGGTGLGLSVVHGIISGFDGSIFADSAVGEGSVFHILLPAAGQRSAASDEEPFVAPRTPTDQGEGRILLVDDEPSVLKLTERMLSRGGYEVVAYLESPRALEDFESHPDRYDLIVTDHTMPKLTGVDLAQAAHTISPSTPILLMSGNDSAVPPDSAEAAGIKKILEKPIPFQDLLEAVKGVLDPASTVA